MPRPSKLFLHLKFFLRITAVLIIISPRTSSFTKVVVPAIFHEYDSQYPEWVTNETIKQIHNYTVFLYQRREPSQPNYIEHNRGRENAVYYKFIVDHYYDFPDVAVFVHAQPHEHNKNFLNMVGCISPNVSYSSINEYFLTRSTSYWRGYEVWVEQCWRDVLQVAWNLTREELIQRLPPTSRLQASLYCCQQFVISRAMVHRRPLEQWKQLQLMLGQRKVCHVGQPEYDSLFVKTNVGPEPDDLPDYEWSHTPGTGRMIQATTSEHLSHVIFGHLPLLMQPFSMGEICENFLTNTVCPGSPCIDYKTFAEDTLLKCDRRVFRYSSGTKRLFPNFHIFMSYGYDFSDVKSVHCSLLDRIPDGPDMETKTSG